MITLPPFDKIGVTPTPLFQNASPSAGLPGSIVNALIFNALQEELQNAIEGAGGLTPTDSDYTQILQSLSFGGIFVGNFSDANDAYSATIPGTIVVPALKAGMRVIGFIQATNATVSPSLAIAGFTTGSAPAPIKRRDGSAPSIGDVAATMTAFRFDGTNWRVDSLVASDINALIAALIASSAKGATNQVTYLGDGTIIQRLIFEGEGGQFSNGLPITPFPVTFPEAFPNECDIVVAMDTSSGGASACYGYGVDSAAATKTTCTLYCNAPTDNLFRANMIIIGR